MISISHNVEAMPFADAVREAVQLAPGVAQLSDSAALSIAKAFQLAQPGWPALAALASGVEVEAEDLNEAIQVARAEVTTSDDLTALNMLACWALSR